MNLTVKNVPEDVYKTLKEEAVRHNRSLNSQVLAALSQSIEEVARKKRMQKSWKELERFVASLPPIPDSTPLIRADRRRH